MVKYYAEVTNFDSLVGRVRKELEKRNLWESTIFIVCSEQGTQLCQVDLLRQWFTHRIGISLARFIKRRKRGGRIGLDRGYHSTLVHELGSNLQGGDCDGNNIASLIRGNGEPIHQYVYGAFTNCRIVDNRDRIFPIRSIRISGTH